MLRLEGWRVNLKRIYRLWKQEGYRVPPLRKKKGASGVADNACNKKERYFNMIYGRMILFLTVWKMAEH